MSGWEKEHLFRLVIETPVHCGVLRGVGALKIPSADGRGLIPSSGCRRPGEFRSVLGLAACRCQSPLSGSYSAGEKLLKQNES